MKFLAPLALLLLLVPITPTAADNVVKRDIATVVVQDARFSVLLTAAKQAGLVGALQGEGPITVFAPTDKAFSALPQGTLASLLRPENKPALVALLKNHIVAGAIRAKDLLPVAKAKTLGGDSLAIGLRVGGANVIQADIECRNGVIHVVDAVLQATAAPRAVPATMTHARIDVVSTLHKAIERGVPTYNGGDHDGCARIYDEAAQRLLQAGRSLPEMDRAMLEGVMAKLSPDGSERAWQLREAFDKILDNAAFKPTSEASMPPGFPAPGPVGRIVMKRYPRYRAARAEGGNSFWTLFQHIKKNKVEMTAPVEMTMDDSMRETDMAFLYETADQGSTGAQGSVDVLDIEPLEVLSIGLRGRRSGAVLDTAKRLMEARIKEDGLTVAGPWRVLGYNSPMVPSNRQYWELQVPIAN
jgi:uncharacterized surface protein with fasciclin (FAS1) repeats